MSNWISFLDVTPAIFVRQFKDHTLTMANPFATPENLPAESRKWPLTLPSDLLIALSSASALVWILGGINSILFLPTATGNRQYVVYGGLDIALGVINLLMCVGAYLTLTKRSIFSAWLTAITATVPCLTPCVVVGIPIGIWMIVYLRRPDVRTEFNRSAG